MAEIDPVVFAGLQSLPFGTGVLDAEGDLYFTNWKWSEFREEHGAVGPAAEPRENYLAACEASDNPDGPLVARGLRAVLDADRPDFTVEYSIRPETDRRWFLLRTVGYEHDQERYALLAHVEITAQKETELDAREERYHLESLLQTIRHDIRGPLSAAIGWTELLEEDYDDERLARVEDSLKRVERIVESTLMEVHDHEEVQEPEPVSLAAAAERAWSYIHPDGATLEIESTATFEADPDLLDHVFENLFRNAVEHADANPHIWVGTHEDGFYVADDGSGIPPGERERVFGSGYTTNEDGRGFGLAIVERIASLHGWDVDVTESESGGARFEFADVEFVAAPEE